MAEHPLLNVVLVGRTGNGKSATANTIVGERVFESKSRAAGVTMECQTHRYVTPDGPIFNVIDTPGLLDLSVSADFISKEIVRCLVLAEGGLNAVLLILSVKNRMTAEEAKALSILQVLFGSKILDYSIVVFSGGDMLAHDGDTLDQYLDGSPAFLKEVLILCGGRVILLDNRTTDETKKAEQLHQLVSLVKDVEKKNKGRPYTNDMYNKIKEETDRHMEKQKELESKGFSEEQVAAMKKDLELSYEQNLKAMSEMVMKTLKEAAEAQEKLIIELKKENADLRKKVEQEDDEGCNIL